MTNSLLAQTTSTNALLVTGSHKKQAGSSKSDIFKKKKTFMQSYREYYQLMLIGRFGDKLPSQSAIAVSRYGLPLVLLFERYDSLIHRLQDCNVHQRINFRQHAITDSPSWPMRNLALTKQWRGFCLPLSLDDLIKRYIKNCHFENASEEHLKSCQKMLVAAVNEDLDMLATVVRAHALDFMIEKNDSKLFDKIFDKVIGLWN